MIPDYQSLMRSVLESCVDGEVSISSTIKKLEDQFELTEEERTELLPSGKQPKFANRVHWARTYLKQAGLVRNTRRGFFEITDSGRNALSSGAQINNDYLEQFEGFQEFKTRRSEPKPVPSETNSDQVGTPDELLRRGYEQINEALASELLDELRDGAPEFFEKTIVSLLLKMGYGTTAISGEVLGRTGDDGVDGVDGVINQDPLGVDQVYVQAKRYGAENKIGSGAIREFYGALGLKDVTKGIFVTTSAFSASAVQTAQKLGARIVLIDGQALASLLIKHEIGCRVEEEFKISRLDEGYFE